MQNTLAYAVYQDLGNEVNILAVFLSLAEAQKFMDNRQNVFYQETQFIH